MGPFIAKERRIPVRRLQIQHRALSQVEWPPGLLHIPPVFTRRDSILHRRCPYPKQRPNQLRLPQMPALHHHELTPTRPRHRQLFVVR